MDKIEAYSLPLNYEHVNYEHVNKDIEKRSDFQKINSNDSNRSRDSKLSFSRESKI